MDVAILETGAPPAALIPRFGRYDTMFERLLSPGFTTASYRVADGEWPERPDGHAAYIITGSPAGVYDGFPWIEQLKAFLRTASGKAKLVGICFGHQIMAEAFGGRVQKSDKGWGVGLHRYQVLHRRPWMDGAASCAVPVSHQDQVIAPAPGSVVLADCDFTPFGMLALGDDMVSMQCHPEFTPDFAAALIEARREWLPDPDGAIASLAEPNDRDAVAGWIRAFLRGETA